MAVTRQRQACKLAVEIILRILAEISEDFLKPMNEGWQSECILREGRVSKVYYLTPVTKEMNQRQVLNQKKLKSCLGCANTVEKYSKDTRS